jgi:transcriptional regulator with XRE-family HTH domain
MSVTALKDVLQKKIKERNINISELERRASLSTGSIRRIVNGLVPNPTIETVVAIANVFNCSIDELLGNRTIKALNPSELHIPKEIIWENNLMKSIFLETYNHIQKNNTTTNLQTVVAFILETYNYCLFKKNGVFDKDFYEWYIKQTFSHIHTGNITLLDVVEKAS